MKITTAEPRSEPPRRTRRTLLRRLVFVAVTLGWSCAVFVAGLGSHSKMEGLFEDYGWQATVRDGGGLTRKAREAARSAMQNFKEPSRAHELPVLQLDIKHKHWMKLAEKRAEALDYGALVTADDDEVPASIRFDGRTVRVRLRLKGDLLDHLEGEDWSFKVKVRDGDQILGRRVFSLQHPRTRGFHLDALFMDEVRRHGVLAVRHDYVRLIVNGVDRGVTDLEDHFSKEMLEAQGRREGVILALEDQMLWDWRQAGGGWMEPPEYYPLARAFRPSKITESPVLKEMDQVATGLLRGFLDGHLRAGDVFDPPTWGRLFAVSEVWDIVHQLRAHNIRFYYNPVHGRLEPIAFDSTPIYPATPTLVRSLDNYLMRRILEDERIRGAFMTALAELRREAQTKEYLDRVRREDARYRSYLRADFPFVRAFWVDSIRSRAKELERVTMDNFDRLRQAAAPFPEPVTALLVHRGGESYLEVVNQSPGIVELKELLVDDGTGLRAVPEAFGKLPDSLPGPGSPDMRTPVSVPLDDTVAEPQNLVLRGHESGRGTPFETRVQAYEAAARRAVLEPVDQEELQRRLPFAVFDPESRELVVPAGDWTVGGQTVMPEGLGLRIRAGATVRFQADSNIIVQGPCNVGEPGGAQVLLRAEPSAPGWQGIAVLRAEAPCRWHNVTVGDTTGVSLRGLPLTGAVTFYQSEVHLRGCRFDGTRAEDALNLVECTFSFEEVAFGHTRSDAFDSDFSKGTIRGGVIDDIGGDGIDFSGSTVEVSGTIFRRVRDKAVSVGEGSTLDVHEITVGECGTAAVAKDGSSLKLSDSRLEGIQYVAVMAYVKKPEFGPGRVECRNVTVTRSGRDFLAQTGSRVLVEGVELEAEDVDIEALYDTGYMKK